MSEPVLGCPHCGKPVGFAPSMASQVVACPHCRGQFQMPDRPPSVSAGPPVRAPRPDDPALSFDEGGRADRGGAGIRAELDSYRSAATLATVFALVGSAGVLIALGLIIQAVVLPAFHGAEDRPGVGGAGLLWLISSLVFAGSAIVGLFLVRSCVLVGVDAARTLRTLERDTAAGPKQK
jgi:DNA-directed RNA polymerase subunit RPC12/RpoP